MPKIRWPLTQPNTHAPILHATCPMPQSHNPFMPQPTLWQMPTKTSFKCDLQSIRTCLFACRSLSLPHLMEYKKKRISENLQLSGCNNNCVEQGTLASSEHKNVYAFFLVTDRTQGFSYSVAATAVVVVVVVATQRLLRRCVNCMRTKIDEYARRRKAKSCANGLLHILVAQRGMQHCGSIKMCAPRKQKYKKQNNNNNNKKAESLWLNLLHSNWLPYVSISDACHILSASAIWRRG